VKYLSKDKDNDDAAGDKGGDILYIGDAKSCTGSSPASYPKADSAQSHRDSFQI